MCIFNFSTCSLRIFSIIWSIIVSFILLVPNALIAKEFSILLKNSHTENICRKISVIDKGIVLCFVADARKVIYKYKLSEVTIKHKGITVYPYELNTGLISSSIKKQDCNEIIKQLYGPHYVDHLPKSYLYMGWINEKGICQERDLEKALLLYNEIFSHDRSNSMVLDRIQNIQIEMSRKDYLLFASDGRFNECAEIDTTDNFFSCGNRKDKLHLLDIDSVYYKKQLVYPYENNWKNNVSDALRHKNCNNIRRYLYGPANIDKNIEANSFLAEMYEYGICVGKNLQTALAFYKKSDIANTLHVTEKINTLSAIILKEKKIREEIIRKQWEEIRKREKEILIDRILLEQEWSTADEYCQNECELSKFKLDQDCYKGCMAGKKQPVKLDQVEEVKKSD